MSAEQIRALVESAYREGVSHGESIATAYEWGSVVGKDQTWEHSDIRAEMETAIAKAIG